MSTTTSFNPRPDMPVTVKVNYEGTTRRFKLPLREMIYPNLEQQVRSLCAVPTDVTTVLERFSDSAAVYVTLDGNNPSVYKQLWRAAKAKSKLKLRLTVVEAEPKNAPKPATVEDESEVTVPDAVAAKVAEVTAEEINLRAYENISAVRRDFEAHFARAMEITKQLSEKKNVKPAPALAQHANVKAVSDVADAPKIQYQSPYLNRARSNSFAVSCNSCEKIMPNEHYHCSTCDDGDFDLCETCVLGGVTCHSDDHWLIKRSMVNGLMVNSTTETIAPKPKKLSNTDENKPAPIRPAGRMRLGAPPAPISPLPCQMPTRLRSWPINQSTRTCNGCVTELPEDRFLHCNDCDDFDLCQTCFSKNTHGHHPKHSFAAAVAGVKIPDGIRVKMATGRNQLHHAVCDGCDKFITGVRHKCLDCPDWDYCSECVANASFVHAGHRFAPLYESIDEVQKEDKAVHVGICCDGPLCSSSKFHPSYIRGIRYKCAVCHDLDFCANCEANPANEHNKTHPLIKFKTAVRNVSVTTHGEGGDGRRMPAMGDRRGPTKSDSRHSLLRAPSQVSSGAENMRAPAAVTLTGKSVDAMPKTEPEVKQEPQIESPGTQEKLAIANPEPEAAAKEQDLRAVFLRDLVMDGSILPPNHVFEQTWYLKNEGTTSWPAGCSVKFVGGDYMGHVDSAHPARISELVSASESTICYTPLAPGQEFPFTVLLRTPPRPGRVTSYWRLTTQDGYKFGHRLWCDVSVRNITLPAREVKTEVREVKPEPVEVKAEEEKEQPKPSDSLMVFPKLEKESPVSSVHQAQSEVARSETTTQTGEEEFEDCVIEDEWDDSDNGFLTDEEYDILDASDEEFLEEQQKAAKK